MGEAGHNVPLRQPGGGGYNSLTLELAATSDAPADLLSICGGQPWPCAVPHPH